MKNPRTHELVRELARRTGQSQTSAVEDAVARRLAALGAEDSDVLATAQRLVADFQADLKDEDRLRIRAAQDELYDEAGLPR
ncbi:type II toxin-antitoxin system VapB family antitoxin [Ornithinimicrobium ciconiae]|uniref:type II toxin-antitoxin system VapB family antitoxin n=1 Tax=Ornithinimicrobium ciconiae TaxID=2594265 RepID=UPI001D19876D|nr:type II toxin-antitoxin system VapB family antitoxin [Ornithinimicrobium ciconiae]